jgi:hypothetical protein
MGIVAWVTSMTNVVLDDGWAQSTKQANFVICFELCDLEK